METQSDQLEQQARRARAQMSGALNELRARMTSGQVLDQLTDYAREGPAAEFVRNLGREVRENPLPLALVGVGVAWLIIASERSARARAARLATRKAVEISAGAPLERAYEGAENEVVVASALPINSEHPGDEAAILAPEVGATATRQTGWQDARHRAGA
jgi:hypothetical protein